MSSHNSLKESLNADIGNTKILDLMANDILVAKNDLENTIDDIKRSINLLFSYVVGSQMKSESLVSLKQQGRQFSVEESASEIIEKSFIELQKKATLDMQFIQLYDKFMAKEIAKKIKNQCVKKHFIIMKEKFDEDFRKLNEEAEKNVMETKSKLEEYIGMKRIEENKKNKEFIDAAVLMNLKDKALNDFHKIKKQSEKNIQITKMRINDNIGVFLTNPAGPKTQEELQSEQFIKDQIISLKETIVEDLKASKEITEKIASRTKQAIENFSLADDDVSREEYKGFNFIVEKLQDKAAHDFKEAKSEMKHKVSNIKETFQNSIRDANTTDSTYDKDNQEELQNVTLQGTSKVLSKNVPITKLKNDFQTIDGKIKEDANDLKVGITDMVNNVKQKLHD